MHFYFTECIYVSYKITTYSYIDCFSVSSTNGLAFVIHIRYIFEVETEF
jgi:hypothetical protein